MKSARNGTRLRWDPVRCDGVGVCAHLAVDLVHIDSWGYPIVSTEPLDASERRAATAAVRACPRRALFFDES